MLTVKNRVNTYLNRRLKLDDDAPYKDKELYFTSEKQLTPKELPTLSVVSLGEVQSNNTLNRQKQNFITSTIEIKAYAKTSYDAFTLANKAGDVMLAMRYSLIYGIEDMSDSSNHISVARYSRLVSPADVLY